MPTTIKKLDETLINKIAAGEVIERPASVVKELVENSVDAGATQITVTLQEGGKKLIRVADNGKGIPANELELAVDRHATSKISQFDDLYALTTCGFRGEALASIASISKMTLASCVEGAEPFEIVIEGGQLIDKRSVAQTRGTTVTSRFLFYQTPARLKFLKSDETELGHVVDVVEKIALLQFNIGFKLLNQDKVILDFPPVLSLAERVRSVLGKDIAEQMYPVVAEQGHLRLEGLLGHPQISRTQRNFGYFFVNNRIVNDKVLWHAVTESYRSLLMKGRYPVFVLKLSIDPQLVDVNVHPTKAEVRFHKSQDIHHFVHRSLREVLAENPWLTSESPNVSSSFGIADQNQNMSSFESFLASETTALKSEGVSVKPNDQPIFDQRLPLQPHMQNWSERYFSGESAEIKSHDNYQSPSSSRLGMDREPQQALAHAVSASVEQSKMNYAVLEPLGQVLATYIICDGGDRMVLIDQHAAHERIGYEKLLLHYQKEGIAKQLLLVPETFDLSPSNCELLKKYIEELNRFGFEIDYFGGHTFVLKSVPVLLLHKINIKEFLNTVLDDIKVKGTLVSLQDSWEHLLATMACHAQIRANHRLTHEEMKALLLELQEYQFTDFCPHGRPVAVEVRKQR